MSLLIETCYSLPKLKIREDLPLHITTTLGLAVVKTAASSQNKQPYQKLLLLSTNQHMQFLDMKILKYSWKNRLKQ